MIPAVLDCILEWAPLTGLHVLCSNRPALAPSFKSTAANSVICEIPSIVQLWQQYLTRCTAHLQQELIARQLLLRESAVFGDCSLSVLIKAWKVVQKGKCGPAGIKRRPYNSNFDGRSLHCRNPSPGLTSSITTTACFQYLHFCNTYYPPTSPLPASPYLRTRKRRPSSCTRHPHVLRARTATQHEGENGLRAVLPFWLARRLAARAGTRLCLGAQQLGHPG